jgi:hypothetical protein
MSEPHRTPARAHAAARETARARSRLLAGELTRLGIPAEGAPGGDRAGVWLDGQDAELASKVLVWVAGCGIDITRETFGLPPAVPMPAEYAPDPEYRPIMVSEKMCNDAVTAYFTQQDDRKAMIAAMAAAGLWDEVLDRGLLDTAQAVFAHEVFVKGLGARKGMTEALVTVLARIPPPAGFADYGERSEAGRAELEEGVQTGRLHDTRGNIKVTCPRGCGQLIWQGAHDGPGGCSAGTASGTVAFPDVIVDEPPGLAGAAGCDQLIMLVSAALCKGGASPGQVRQFQIGAGSFTWYRKALDVARHWVTIRSPDEDGSNKPPEPGQ